MAGAMPSAARAARVAAGAAAGVGVGAGGAAMDLGAPCSSSACHTGPGPLAACSRP